MLVRYDWLHFFDEYFHEIYVIFEEIGYLGDKLGVLTDN